MQTKFNFYLLLILLSTMILPSCYSVRKSVELSKPNSEKINWPKGYAPEEASFFVHNEIAINADPQVVWDILIQAEKWPDWYIGAKNVRLTNNSSGKLENQSVFSWNTMGQNFETTIIKEFKPPFRLSWEATKNNIRGYHAWLIIPNEEGGCKVVTSETQHGFLTLMQKLFVPNKLRKLHDVWLEELKSKAENETS
jgi:uncharacterized protein YndB with AHSA1/START domain